MDRRLEVNMLCFKSNVSLDPRIETPLYCLRMTLQRCFAPTKITVFVCDLDEQPPRRNAKVLNGSYFAHCRFFKLKAAGQVGAGWYGATQMYSKDWSRKDQSGARHLDTDDMSSNQAFRLLELNHPSALTRSRAGHPRTFLVGAGSSVLHCGRLASASGTSDPELAQR
jgi:hypothetical protein